MSAFDEDDDIPSPFGRRKKVSAMYRMGTKGGNVVIPSVDSPLAASQGPTTNASTTADETISSPTAVPSSPPAAPTAAPGEANPQSTNSGKVSHSASDQGPHSLTESTSGPLPPISGNAESNQSGDDVSRKITYEYKYRPPRGLSAILGTMPTEHTTAPTSGNADSSAGAEPSEAVLRQLQAGRASLKSSMVCRPSDLLEGAGSSTTSVSTAHGTSSASPIRPLYPVGPPPIVGSKTSGVRVPTLDFTKVKTEEQEKAEALKKQQAAAAANKRKFVIKSNKKVEGPSGSTIAGSANESSIEPCFVVIGRDGKPLTAKQIADIVALGYSDTEYSDDEMVVGKSTLLVVQSQPQSVSISTAVVKTSHTPQSTTQSTATPVSKVLSLTVTKSDTSSKTPATTSGAVVGNWSKPAGSTASTAPITNNKNLLAQPDSKKSTAPSTTAPSSHPVPVKESMDKITVSSAETPIQKPATPAVPTPTGATVGTSVSTSSTPAKSTKPTTSASPDVKKTGTSVAVNKTVNTSHTASKVAPISVTKKVTSANATVSSKISMLDMHRKAAAAIAARSNVPQQPQGTQEDPKTVSEGADAAGSSPAAPPPTVPAKKPTSLVTSSKSTAVPTSTGGSAKQPIKTASSVHANPGPSLSFSALNTSSEGVNARPTPSTDKVKATPSTTTSSGPAKVSPFRARSPYSMPLAGPSTSVSKLSASKKVNPTVSAAAVPLRPAVRPAASVSSLPTNTESAAGDLPTKSTISREPWPTSNKARPTSPFSYLQTTASSRSAAAESAKVRAEVAGKSPDRRRSLSASRQDSTSNASSAAPPSAGAPAPVIGFRTKGPSAHATPSTAPIPATSHAKPPFMATTTTATRLSSSSATTHGASTTSPQRRVTSATRSNGVSPYRTRPATSDNEPRAFSRGSSMVHGPERLAAAVLAHAKKEKVLTSPPTSGNNRRDSDDVDGERARRVVSFNKNKTEQQQQPAATAVESSTHVVAADGELNSGGRPVGSTKVSITPSTRKVFNNLQRPTAYSVGGK